MKKAIILLLALMLMLSLAACGSGASSSSSKEESSSSSSDESTELSKTDIESIAASALYRAIVDKQSSGLLGGGNVDAGSTRYEVSTIDETADGYVAYGRGVFYDKFGNVTPWQPTANGKNSYGFTFTVEIDKNGNAICDFKTN